MPSCGENFFCEEAAYMNHFRLTLAVLLALPLAYANSGCKGSVGNGLKGGVQLTLESTDQMYLSFGEPVEVAARLTYIDGGAPAVDRPVDFALVGDTYGSAISDRTKSTDADGRVTITLTGGPSPTPDTGFQLTISTAQATNKTYDPTLTNLRVTVVVDGNERGYLQVKVSLESGATLTMSKIDSRVYLQSGPSADCSRFNTDFTNGMPNGLYSGYVVKKDLANTSEVWTIKSVNGFRVGANVMVVAGAYGADPNKLVAAGCFATKTGFVARQTLPAPVVMKILPLEVKNVYDFATILNIASATPWGGYVKTLDAWMSAPARTAASTIEVEAAKAIGISYSGTVALAVCSVYASMLYPTGAATLAGDANRNGDFDPENGDCLDDIIQREMLSKAPAWVTSTLLAGGDIADLLLKLTVGGDMEIKEITPVPVVGGKPEDPTVQWTFKGTWNWTAFMFPWRLGVTGCKPEDTCCPDSRQIFSTEDVYGQALWGSVNTNSSMSPMGADVAGTLDVVPSKPLERTITMTDQRVSLHYGQILDYAIRTLLLPSITHIPECQATPTSCSVGCHVESFFGCIDNVGTMSCNSTTCGCAVVGDWLKNKLGNNWFGNLLTVQALTSICRTGLDLGTRALTSALDSMQYDGSDNGRLTMSIKGRLKDTDGDDRADSLVVPVGNGATEGLNGKVSMAYQETQPDGSVLTKFEDWDFTGSMNGDLERKVCGVSNDRPANVAAGTLAACTNFEACSVRNGVLNECGGREVCMPRAGIKLGGVACVKDIECRSNKCLPNGKCYQACDPNGPATQCATGFKCNPTKVDVPLPPTSAHMAVNTCVKS